MCSTIWVFTWQTKLPGFAWGCGCCWLFFLNSLEKNPVFCSADFCAGLGDGAFGWLVGVSSGSTASLIGELAMDEGVFTDGEGVVRVWLVSGVTAAFWIVEGADTDLGTGKCEITFNYYLNKSRLTFWKTTDKYWNVYI